MAPEMATHVDELDWARVVERLLYLFPPVVGVGIVGVLQDAEPGVPGLQFALYLISGFGYTVLTFGLTAALFFDARRIRRRPSAGAHWRPNPILNGLLAFVAPPVAGVVYLARRHRRFGTRPGWSGWWLVVAVSFGTTLFGLVAVAVAIIFTIPGLLTGAVAVAGAIAFGSFPIAIYQDAAYVCTYGDSWRPNPGLYLGVAFLSLSVPLLQPIVAGYYLARRRREMGTP